MDQSTCTGRSTSSDDFKKEYGVARREKHASIKCSSAESKWRAGAYWRNAVRARIRFYPKDLPFDAYDHAPVY